jgi:hypothetical protein
MENHPGFQKDEEILVNYGDPPIDCKCVLCNGPEEMEDSTSQEEL